MSEPHPRLGIVDEGSSEITVGAQALEGIDVSMLESVGELVRKAQCLGR